MKYAFNLSLILNCFFCGAQTSDEQIRHCQIDTTLFKDILYPPNESDFISLNETYDSTLNKVHVLKLKHRDGSSLEFDSQQLYLYTSDETIYLDGEPFSGLAFTHNDFFLEGTWRKKGMYAEFKGGKMKGKTVQYLNDGSIYQIFDNEKKLLKRFNTNSKVILLEQYELFSNGASIEYYNNGKIKQKNYFILYDNGNTGSNSYPTESYNMNGDLLLKTEYHCNKWPLMKSRFSKDNNYIVNEYWIEETIKSLHKYQHIKTLTNSNLSYEQGVFYRFIDNNGIIRGDLEFKDSIWEYGIKGETETTIIQYSAKLSIEKYKNQKGLQEVKNGVFIKKAKNGQIIISGRYENNYMDGLWTYYYSNGALRCSVNYTKGLLTGNYVYYDINGRILRQGQYNSILEVSVDRNRSLNFSVDHAVEDENGIFTFPQEGLEGVCVFNYYGNGKSKNETYTFSNGLLSGPYEIYENGILKEKGIKP